MDITKLPEFTDFFTATFDGLMAVAQTTPNSTDQFKVTMQSKIEAVRDQASKELVDLLLDKVKSDVIEKFKTDLGLL